MADKEISALTAASALSGTEVVHGVQGGNSRKITTQAIANLAVAGETVISSTTTSSSAASVTFSSIPATYRHLFVRAFARSSISLTDADTLLMQFNGDTGSNYTWCRDGAADTGSTFASGSTSASAATVGFITGATSTASFPGFTEVQIPFYANTSWKKVGWCKSIGKGSSGVYQMNLGYSWNNTAAISSILVKPSGALTFIDGSIIELIGIT